QSPAPAPHRPVRGQLTLPWSEWSDAKPIPYRFTERDHQPPAAQKVPDACRRGTARAFDACAKSGCRPLERGDSIGTNRMNGDRWNRTWVARSKSPRNNPWPAAIPRFSLWALAPLVSPRVGGSWTRILIASWWRHGRGSADGRGRCAETRNFQSISG